MLLHVKIHLSPQSTNVKTGPIPVSTSSMETCPDVCPFKKGACYASGGPLLLHWRKVSGGERGMAYADFISAVKGFRAGQVWRHNQAGDLAGQNNRIDFSMLTELVEANRNKRGFTYTHKPVLDNQSEHAAENREAVKYANSNGFTVNLSANSLSHADELLKLNVGPVCAVVPMDVEKNTLTPAGNRVVICPAAVRDGVSCSNCKLCSFAKREYVIAFPAHGVKKKALSAMVSEKQKNALAA